MKYLRALLLIAFCVGFPLLAGASSSDDPYYLYQAGNWFAGRGDLNLETQTSYGTRDTRLLGPNALEQSLCLRVAGTDWLSLEAWGGAAIPTSSRTAAEGAVKQDYTYSADLYARLLKQDGQYLNLALGLGYRNDFNETSIPRVHLNVDRSWGRFDMALSTLAEIPVSVSKATPNGQPALKYDDVDWVVSYAASYEVADWVRIGGEAEIDDMEGFWETDEAEGGAKLDIGPTARFAITKAFHARVNVGAVVPVTVNSPTSVAGLTAPPSRVGVLGCVAFGYDF
jgi:hypothetical protein